MLGSEFINAYASKGAAAWEAAALALAKEPNAPSVVVWPWRDVHLTDGVNVLTLRVQSDVFSIGTPSDFVRLPLTPLIAQAIFNQFGWLMPTPMLVYRIWQNATQLQPTAMVPNGGANLIQYAAHSEIITRQLRDKSIDPATFPLLGGIKKHVVISNQIVKGKVVIFGWYRPSPPAMNVFEDHTSMGNPTRQPIQPLSNVHGDFYVDYSHGIQGVAGTSGLNGQVVQTADVYRDPVLSKLVSHEGALRQIRYGEAPQALPSKGLLITPVSPGLSELGLSEFLRRG